MTKLDLLKSGIGFATSAGISQIVGGFVRNNTTCENAVQKGTVWVAKIGLTTVISEVLRTMTDKKIDNAVEWYDENITKELAKEKDGLSK